MSFHTIPGAETLIVNTETHKETGVIVQRFGDGYVEWADWITWDVL